MTVQTTQDVQMKKLRDKTYFDIDQIKSINVAGIGWVNTDASSIEYFGLNDTPCFAYTDPSTKSKVWTPLENILSYSNKSS